MEITKIIALIIFIIILSIIYINNTSKKIENFEDNDTDRLIVKDMENNTEENVLNNQIFITKKDIETGINTNYVDTSKLNVSNNIDVKNNAYVGKNIIIGNEGNKWILHSPDDNRKSLFIAPFVNGKWDWSKQLHIKSDGIVLQDGNLNIKGNIISNKSLNVKGGKSVHNPNGWGTHFPWSDGKNYIRGDTEIRGDITKIGDTYGNHCIIYGPGNRYKFCFQGDGHPVQYKDGEEVWATGKFG